MKKELSILCCLWVVSLSAGIGSEMSYSNAIALAQQEAWQPTQDQLNALLVDQPDRTDLLYDAGVSSYRLQQFEQAHAYFNSALTGNSITIDLKKQAHFNLGNTKVALNQLPEAIEQYDEVLKLDPQNEAAQQNQALVKKMLEEQQKKQKQEKNDQKDEKQRQKKDRDEDQGSSEDDKQDQEEEKSGEDSQQDNEKEDSPSSAAEDKKNERSDQQQKGQQEQRADNKPDHKQTDNQQNNLSESHDSPSQETRHQQQQKDESHHTQKEQKEQAAQVGQEVTTDYRQEELKKIEDQLDPRDKWMARALQKLEQQEEHEQKKMIKATVQKQTGQNGQLQNDW